MSRMNAVVVTIILALTVNPVSQADEPTINLGEKFRGEISGEPKPTPGVHDDGTISRDYTGRGYQANFTVKLKAGQAALFSARVFGDDRKIRLIVRDRTGKPIAATKMVTGSCTLKIKEVGATGSHIVDVVSDRVGDFTLLVTTDEELSEKDRQKRIEQLEEELRELKKSKEKQDK